MAYGEHTMKKSIVFEWHKRFYEGLKMCMIMQEVSDQKYKE